MYDVAALFDKKKMRKKKKKYERKYYLFSFRKNLEIALVGHVKSKKSIHTWYRGMVLDRNFYRPSPC